MARRRRVFISYHHDKDESYRRIFELRFGNRFRAIIPGSVRPGDIPGGLSAEHLRRRIRDGYLRDTSVTVVLVGGETWRRKYVDWEISSSLRSTLHNPRSGLLGLFLPSHASYGEVDYDPRTVPARLIDNALCGYAVLADWSNDPDEVFRLVNLAYGRKSRYQPDNRRPLFKRNR